MSMISISSLKEQAGEVPLIASITAQLQSRTVKMTKGGKPYFDLVFGDSTGSLSLKVWSETPLHSQAESIELNAILKIKGEWTQNQYGVNGSDISWEPLGGDDIADFLAGDPQIRKKQEKDYADIASFCGSMEDPRLKKLCLAFLGIQGDHFRRTAAARKNHHARRGGLVEHVAQMMRSADAISRIYPELNRDLLISGVLFHDCGKLWENSYPEDGFSQIHSKHAEMLGHIPLGIEYVNHLWRKLATDGEFREFSDYKPATDEVRYHLLHLIASHHGQLEYGSPVLPKTPEAFALHYIDNLDAKMEMLRDAYGQANELAPGVYERVFPLPTSLVKPLGKLEKGE